MKTLLVFLTFPLYGIAVMCLAVCYMVTRNGGETLRDWLQREVVQ